jgi:hypothetical protein
MCFVGTYSRFEENGSIINNVNGAFGYIIAV